jgi:actin-like ATPase involved in cell morphogenesis
MAVLRDGQLEVAGALPLGCRDLAERAQDEEWARVVRVFAQQVSQRFDGLCASLPERVWADLTATPVLLTGGGARLRLLPETLAAVGLPVRVAPNAHNAVVEGMGAMLPVCAATRAW